MMKPLDYLIIGTIALLALGLFYYNSSQFFVEADAPLEVFVQYKGEEIGRYPLDTNQLVDLLEDGHSNIIEIKEGQVTMIESDCNDQICVKTAPIDRPGQSIVCLPHQLFVEIVGGTEEGDDLDAISQ